MSEQKDTEMNQEETHVIKNHTSVTAKPEELISLTKVAASKPLKKTSKSQSTRKIESMTDKSKSPRKVGAKQSVMKQREPKTASGKTSDVKTKSLKKATAQTTTKHEYVQQSIKDHFFVRRSSRKTTAVLEKEEFESIASKLLSKDESGLKSIDIDGKGKGIVASRPFNKGELICEYSGEQITHDEASEREESYKKNTSIGCYMYYFQYKDRKLCVDATKDDGRFGRLVNHSKTSSNVIVKIIPIYEHPYLCLIAKRNIEIDEELQYDYGERDKEVIASHPWLTT